MNNGDNELLAFCPGVCVLLSCVCSPIKCLLLCPGIKMQAVC